LRWSRGARGTWDGDYNESFSEKLRDELLNLEVFMSLWEAKALVEQWRREYGQVRPYSSLGYRAPAPAAIRTGSSTRAILSLGVVQQLGQVRDRAAPLEAAASERSTSLSPT
jgi:hypothetical protein